MGVNLLTIFGFFLLGAWTLFNMWWSFNNRKWSMLNLNQAKINLFNANENLIQAQLAESQSKSKQAFQDAIDNSMIQ